MPKNSKLRKKMMIKVLKDHVLTYSAILTSLKSDERILIGRSRDCDLVMRDHTISRNHAEIRMDITGEVSIEDLGSIHGTKVDEKWIKPKIPWKIGPDTHIRFGTSSEVCIVAVLN